jgi:hypothetical protein
VRHAIVLAAAHEGGEDAVKRELRLGLLGSSAMRCYIGEVEAILFPPSSASPPVR